MGSRSSADWKDSVSEHLNTAQSGWLEPQWCQHYPHGAVQRTAPGGCVLLSTHSALSYSSFIIDCCSPMKREQCQEGRCQRGVTCSNGGRNGREREKGHSSGPRQTGGHTFRVAVGTMTAHMRVSSERNIAAVVCVMCLS